MNLAVTYICTCMNVIVYLTSAFEMPIAVERIKEFNKTAKAFTVRAPFPHGRIILFMDTENKLLPFNYTVECNDTNSKYILKASSDDTFLVTIETDYIIIDCNNRTLEPFPPVPLNINMTEYSAKDSTFVQSYNSASKDKVSGERRYAVKGISILRFKADMLGRTFITFRLYNYSGSEDENHDNYHMIKFPAIIFRLIRPIDHAFRIVIYVFLVFVTLAFGCKLDLEIVKAVMKKPVAPCIGMGCQFIAMPLIGYGVAKIVTRDRPDVALGIFVAGCCPGGGASNIYSYLLGGDLSLSITMTALSTVLAFGMMPLWIYTLGQTFIARDVNVPFLSIFTTLLVLILPLFVGLFIKTKLPKVQKILVKIIKPVTVVCIILLLSVGIYSNLYIFKLFEPKIVLAGCLLPYFGYVIGGTIAFIARLPWDRVKTVAIETGMQNTGVAMILMMYAFPPPDGMIAAVAPIASAVMTPLPLFVITIPYLIYRKCNKDKYKSVSTEKEKDEEMKESPSDEPIKTKNGEALLG